MSPFNSDTFVFNLFHHASCLDYFSLSLINRCFAKIFRENWKGELYSRTHAYRGEGIVWNALDADDTHMSAMTSGYEREMIKITFNEGRGSLTFNHWGEKELSVVRKEYHLDSRRDKNVLIYRCNPNGQVFYFKVEENDLLFNYNPQTIYKLQYVPRTRSFHQKSRGFLIKDKSLRSFRHILKLYLRRFKVPKRLWHHVLRYHMVQ